MLENEQKQNESVPATSIEDNRWLLDQQTLILPFAIARQRHVVYNLWGVCVIIIFGPNMCELNF